MYYTVFVLILVVFVLGSSLLQIFVCPRTSLRQADFPAEISGLAGVVYNLLLQARLGLILFS